MQSWEQVWEHVKDYIHIKQTWCTHTYAPHIVLHMQYINSIMHTLITHTHTHVLAYYVRTTTVHAGIIFPGSKDHNQYVL